MYPHHLCFKSLFVSFEEISASPHVQLPGMASTRIQEAAHWWSKHILLSPSAGMRKNHCNLKISIPPVTIFLQMARDVQRALLMAHACNPVSCTLMLLCSVTINMLGAHRRKNPSYPMLVYPVPFSSVIHENICFVIVHVIFGEVLSEMFLHWA